MGITIAQNYKYNCTPYHSFDKIMSSNLKYSKKIYSHIVVLHPLATRVCNRMNFKIGVNSNALSVRQLNDIHNHIYFNTGSTMLLRGSDILAEVKDHLNKLIKKIDVYIRNGSGWSLVRVSEIAIMTTKYNPMGGSSYIELPTELKKEIV